MKRRMKFHCHRRTGENIVESHKLPLKNCKRKIGYMESEDDKRKQLRIWKTSINSMKTNVKRRIGFLK
jgi:hypothetical protein